jgi:hypothetical protein
MVVKQTRGLNRSHELKSIFNGAATTVIGRAQEDDPIYHHYELMLVNKTSLAKLTIARQIAAITLSVWKRGCSGVRQGSASASRILAQPPPCT